MIKSDHSIITRCIRIQRLEEKKWNRINGGEVKVKKRGLVINYFCLPLHILNTLFRIENVDILTMRIDVNVKLIDMKEVINGTRNG